LINRSAAGKIHIIFPSQGPGTRPTGTKKESSFVVCDVKRIVRYAVGLVDVGMPEEKWTPKFGQ
jgi:hypothetical protein